MTPYEKWYLLHRKRARLAHLNSGNTLVTRSALAAAV